MVWTTRTAGIAAGDGGQCKRSGHPLEAIAFFRRFKPSLLRDLLYTFIWNSAFVFVFTVLGKLFEPREPLMQMLWVNFVIANCIGFLIHLAFRFLGQLLGERVTRQSFAVRTLYYSSISVAGVFGGYWLGFTLLSWDTARNAILSPQTAMTMLLLSLIISLFLATMFYAREQQAKAEANFERERARGEAAERHAKVAQLKLLEAQIEPHFLYNTLANVISLIDSSPATAKRMVEQLIEYLRSAAATPDAGSTTLGRQVELLRAYLDLIAVRMGSRLSYRIDMPSALGALPLPPMLLQPVVENAIKHGLEPKIDGGLVTVGARRDGDALILDVTDNGLGFRTTSAQGGGLGLANLRERLANLYEGRARLEITDRQPGTRVTISLPTGPIA